MSYASGDESRELDLVDFIFKYIESYKKDPRLIHSL